ncbi:IS3 family transposase [Streptomyces sp. NBC_01217]|uniref:IS3 family transposase n=1 Tax=Streptomyces sp. NBC_01217 TaxID=2903779 RepID=UPI002E0E3899|nr:IS3 family transposase [Streptomyces sp. NBC_01217]WSQ62586.1 IS3 family transposase [Streptomyces sp. NBC_01217]
MTGTDPAALAAFIGDQRIGHRVPHRLACQVLGVSESWFYKWRDRPTTARELRRGQLADTIRQIFESSGGTCGSPKVWLLLVRSSWRDSVNTVARLMAEPGLAGRKIRRRPGLTRPGKRPAAPDFVRRDLTADAPDQVWCGDMTEITTHEGKLYLATVIDLFSRRLLGYAMDARHDAELVVASLNMAAATRGGDVKGVILHSDRGSEGGFNWSSQRLDHGGARWGETRRRCRSCLRVRDGSGRRIGRWDRRCVRQADRSRLVRCSGTSGGGSRRE